MENDEQKPIKLPEWRGCLELMLSQGVDYGKVYSAEFFEEHLREQRDSMKFGLSISEIRRELEKNGFYLSGRGQKGSQFVILKPESNQEVMQSYNRAAIDALKRGVILGTSTRIDLLSEEDRRRHEKILEKMATRSVLMARSESVRKLIEKKNPRLLELPSQ
jgi:hypothetical protein